PHGDTEWLSRRSGKSLVQSRVEFAITLETRLHHFCTHVIEVDFLSSFVERTFPRFAVGAMSSLHQFVGRSLAGRSAPDAIAFHCHSRIRFDLDVLGKRYPRIDHEERDFEINLECLVVWCVEFAQVQ